MGSGVPQSPVVSFLRASKPGVAGSRPAGRANTPQACWPRQAGSRARRGSLRSPRAGSRPAGRAGRSAGMTSLQWVSIAFAAVLVVFVDATFFLKDCLRACNKTPNRHRRGSSCRLLNTGRLYGTRPGSWRARPGVAAGECGVMQVGLIQERTVPRRLERSSVQRFKSLSTRSRLRVMVRACRDRRFRLVSLLLVRGQRGCRA